MEAIVTGGTLIDYAFIIILVLIEAGVLLGASALVCKYTKIKAKSNTRFYSVFCIANAILIAMVVLSVVLCMIYCPDMSLDDDWAWLLLLAIFYVLPSLVIMQIISIVSVVVRKINDKKIDRLISEAEDKIENAIKNSDKINKDKT